MDILPQNGENCTCAEGKFENKDGETVPTGLAAHDCEYVRPQAESFANSKVPEDPGGRLWSRAFSRQMEKLMHESENGGGDQ